MKLNYDEVKRYYDNGLLNDLVVRGGFCYYDIIQSLCSHIELRELEVERLETILADTSDDEGWLREEHLVMEEKCEELEDKVIKYREGLIRLSNELL